MFKNVRFWLKHKLTSVLTIDQEEEEFFLSPFDFSSYQKIPESAAEPP